MGSIVIDANIGLALVLPLAYSEQAASRIRDWMARGDDLAAPVLWSYEIVSALYRAQRQGIVAADQISGSLEQLLSLGVEQVTPSLELHSRAFGWAARLDQPTAYDAQYLSLAENLGADFWTADRRLVKSAQAEGVSWVHWIGEGTA